MIARTGRRVKIAATHVSQKHEVRRKATARVASAMKRPGKPRRGHSRGDPCGRLPHNPQRVKIAATHFVTKHSAQLFLDIETAKTIQAALIISTHVSLVTFATFGKVTSSSRGENRSGQYYTSGTCCCDKSYNRARKLDNPVKDDYTKVTAVTKGLPISRQKKRERDNA